MNSLEIVLNYRKVCFDVLICYRNFFLFIFPTSNYISISKGVVYPFTDFYSRTHKSFSISHDITNENFVTECEEPAVLRLNRLPDHPFFPISVKPTSENGQTSLYSTLFNLSDFLYFKLGRVYFSVRRTNSAIPFQGYSSVVKEITYML